MPTYALVIGVYPTTPQTDPTDFVLNYLTGLTITAFEVDFASPSPSAALQPPANQIGTATYPGSIFQLETEIGGLPAPAAAGAALIDIPAALAGQFIDPAGDAFTTPANPLINVVLSVQRNGIAIADDSVNYDVNVATEPIIVPITSLSDLPVALYLGLGPGGTELGSQPYLQLPADGSPPSYTDLDTAIGQIIQADPGSAGSYDPAALTSAQCLNLARELVSNRTANPLPVPSPDLGALYTAESGDPNSQQREQFDSALQTFYATLNAQATRLASYIAAWSSAQYCAAATASATSAGLTFPVRLTSAPGAGQIAQATVILQND
jgi:hypothetical protein